MKFVKILRKDSLKHKLHDYTWFRFCAPNVLRKQSQALAYLRNQNWKPLQLKNAKYYLAFSFLNFNNEQPRKDGKHRPYSFNIENPSANKRKLFVLTTRKKTTRILLYGALVRLNIKCVELFAKASHVFRKLILLIASYSAILNWFWWFTLSTLMGTSPDLFSLRVCSHISTMKPSLSCWFQCQAKFLIHFPSFCAYFIVSS